MNAADDAAELKDLQREAQRSVIPLRPPVNPNRAAAKVVALDDDAANKEIDRLSKLEALAYSRARAEAARAIGIGLGVLDKLVKTKRCKDNQEPSAMGQGRPLNLPEFDPWPEPVHGAVLLDSLASTLREYVIISDVQADAVALWSVHTHVHDASDFSPNLVLKSSQKRSGKSRLAEVLERAVAAPLYVSGIKAAALLRIIEMRAPTLLLDEMDATMKQSPEMAEALRGIINSGFNRAGARYIMNVPTPDRGFEPREFSTWAPKLLSGIGNLPDTVRDRSIEIEMKRKRRDEKVKRLRRKDGNDLHVLGRKSARWAHDNMEKLRDAEPDAPSGMNDRAADAWDQLFAIADLAGEDWPRRARAAALALSGEAIEEDDNRGTMLLDDIRAVFTSERSADRGVFSTPNGPAISSIRLAAALAAMEGRPWAEYQHGSPLTPNGLARLLKPYKVRPHDIRDGERVAKSYRLDQLIDAFDRYLGNSHLDSSASPLQPAESCGISAQEQPLQGLSVSRMDFSENPQVSVRCRSVADRDPLLYEFVL